MTRREQVEAVASVAGITPAQARMALDAVGGLVMAGLLSEGEKSTLPVLGTFTVQRRRPRTVRNPATGVMMDLPASAVVKFRPSSALRKIVNERHAARAIEEDNHRRREAPRV